MVSLVLAPAEGFVEPLGPLTKWGSFTMENVVFYLHDSQKVY